MESKVRILFVIANAQLSGAERQLLLLASHLDKTNFEVEICCLEGEGTFTEAVKKTGLPIHIIERSKSIDLKRLIRFTQLVKQRKYQIVHSFTWSANQYARLVRLFVKYILISGERGRDLELINLENFVDTLLSPMSDYIVFNSAVQHDKYVTKIFLKKIPIGTIYNGIEVNKFKENQNKNFLKHSLNLNGNTKLIGIVSNFTAPKNFEMFIKVCEKITDMVPNSYFVAIGDGKKRKYYAEIIHQKKLENRISLIGRREDFHEILSGFDLFLLTSTQEGMPNSIMEAMIAGVPVVTTNVDGCSELIQDSINGFLVDTNNVSSMVSKIMLLLEDSAFRQKVIRNGLQTIQSKFSLEKMVSDYESLYLNLIKSKKN